ncbi:MAG: DUF1926 domain-containing protein [Chloroflexi bacterium]|nr:DUF1926 domain-containing protein [Chloroflexota bacterium]
MKTNNDPKVYLALVIHNHQPVGNFPWVFERAYDQAYLPMLDALEGHPSVRMSVHYSGPLLDWLEVNRPEFLKRLKALVAMGRIEIVGGAYYEPVLSAIPDSDKHGQIEKMAGYCLNRFGSRPSGFWLAERVWEPSLPVHLAKAGVQWTVLDDTHFKTVGLEDGDLFGYYLTEDQGCPLKVFATSKFLRYNVPFKPVEDVISYLRNNTSVLPRVVVMGDDGEKFGIWPDTYEHCWGKNSWMKQFFAALEQNSSWLSTITTGQFARQFRPLGRVYLPCSSYDEMGEWALPADKSRAYSAIKHKMESEGRTDVVRFLRGGFWRSFAVKYPEANWMQKKMLRVHRKVHMALEQKGTPAGQDELWQGQCNCPYWHGIFGGLYLADIRAATYQHLIEAEKQADAALHQPGPWINSETTDIDTDGYEEIIVDSPAFSIAFSPQQGGAIVEWDIKHPAYNLLSTLARRPEAYHKDIAAAMAAGRSSGTETIHSGIRLKDQLVSFRLACDRHPRSSLLDHFLGPEINLERFIGVDYPEMGEFAGLPYQARVSSEGNKVALAFSRNAYVIDSGVQVPISIHKTIILEAGRSAVSAAYELHNDADRPVSGIFAVEWNINLLGGGHNPAAYYEVPGVPLDNSLLDSAGVLGPVSRLVLGNRYLGIRLELSIDPACEVWRFPVETVSNSEGGVELLYQGSCILVRKPFHLDAGQRLDLGLDWLQAG